LKIFSFKLSIHEEKCDNYTKNRFLKNARRERENRDLIRRIDRYLSLGGTNMSLVDYRFAQACRLPSSGLYSLEIALEITCNTPFTLPRIV